MTKLINHNNTPILMKHIINSLLLAGMTAVLVSCGCDENFYSRTKQQLYIGDDIAVAQTQYGKVRGYIMRDTYTFLGIPYGASTAGENRFMPPQPPQPWDGIKPAYFYGACAPQSEMQFPNNSRTFLDCWNYYDMSEDCLNLNVWTPGLDGKKRPVIVWLHGGGFSSGNSYEHHEYLGENFSHYCDVVFVSPNHRLNSIGFTDFSAVDPKFKDSGNVGMLDLVAALQWVHDNIANFGGDPGNVTIIGQSGGGAKVCNLVAMPETEGLVHKAVALSGSASSATDKEYASDLGKAIAEAAGVKGPEDMHILQEMPYQEYRALADKVAREYSAKNGSVRRGGFSPVADDLHIPGGDFYAPGSHSSNIPMIICTTTCEWPSAIDDAARHALTKEQVIAEMSERYGAEKAAAIYDAYAAIFPDKLPIEVYDLANSSRSGALKVAGLRNAIGAPVYMAWFDWQGPVFDGRVHAMHTMDIAFWFMNTDLQVSHTGGGQYPRNLSKKMAKALNNFMRTGDPNGKTGLPKWPAFDQESGATMVLADKCYVLDNPDKQALELTAR